ncbi:hypothetical protein DFR55_12018 [Herbinix hemicellulosilytica]|uniref:Uncharacterized protein n=1 Tax=Herbinix hemicellulosilytica TaxID=1564487 RepID=A0A0H5SFE5_HERHM|nr:hypothetical protein [Herbinix hemicellulosilytica]RBP57676.1 hypothetical protein DFR55_12018 [Herbinix hemicellulosilytica]CRZ34159.1 hypothetical protein HHT355_0956 [Herbinix hemicellulosilytica]
MKRLYFGLLFFFVVLFIVSCNKKNRHVNIGNLSFDYDPNVWELVEKTDNSGPLELKDKDNNIISINVTKESTYQHPMTMISFIDNLLSENDGFEVYKEPSEITVNNTQWYEYGYLFKVDSTTYKIYQRYYGKYYNAASVSFTSTIEKFDAGFEEALKLFSGIKVEEIDNKENEDKAKKFLVGEWDLNGKGYLILNDDGTYEWYSDNSKDKNNMHYGTYGCDVENVDMNMYEGDGIYLVLFPEALIVDGEESASLQYKNDYFISFEKDENDSYPMVNIGTYTLYTLTKQ